MKNSTERDHREKAIIVGIKLPEHSIYEIEDHLDELEKLCDTAGALVIGRIIQERKRVDPTYFIGKGKVAELSQFIQNENISLVVFDDDLTPAQTRNLEKELKTKILDRSALILDIFAAHARTREAKTQVELAQLQYLLPRLTRQWTHLSRQVGGIGTKGPGETQLETDRRLVRARISKLKKELEKIELQRNVRQKGREEFYRISLIGYTNAGKSSLMKLLTNADVKVENKLFATLDSTVRKFHLGPNREALISDTVGFIRKLPHHLVASFRSTLAEINDADLLLHVIDISDPVFEDHIQVVRQVLKDLGIGNKDVIHVFNKIDLLKESSMIRHLKNYYPDSVFMSVERRIGVRMLISKINEMIDRRFAISEWRIPMEKIQERSVFLKYGQILYEEIFNEEFYKMITKIEHEKLSKLLKEHVHFESWKVK